MSTLSLTEENYIKSIYHLSDGGKDFVSTNAIAENINIAAASVTDMIKRLARKKYLLYKKYKGVNLSDMGLAEALKLIRKHRLWETFLVNKLRFKWDEVHEVAEQLEHIKSSLLISELDRFLEFPKTDPHGDPIPDENGHFTIQQNTALAETSVNDKVCVSGVKQDEASFLRYLDKIGIRIGTKIKVIDTIDFDGSLEISIEGLHNVYLSKEVGKNILVTKY